MTKKVVAALLVFSLYVSLRPTTVFAWCVWKVGSSCQKEDKKPQQNIQVKTGETVQKSTQTNVQKTETVVGGQSATFNASDKIEAKVVDFTQLLQGVADQSLTIQNSTKSFSDSLNSNLESLQSKPFNVDLLKQPIKIQTQEPVKIQQPLEIKNHNDIPFSVDVKDLNNTVNDLKGVVSGLSSTLNTALGAINSTIAAYNNNSLSAGISSDISALNNTLGTINTTIGNMSFQAGGGSSALTIQNINATGSVTAWGSTVVIGATAPTANISITLPTIAAGDVGKVINFIRADNTTFTVTLVAPGGVTLTTLSSGSQLNTQNGGLTVTADTTSTAREVSDSATVVAADYGVNTTITHNQTISSNTYVDVTNGSITLPSSGTYDITYYVSSRTTATNGTQSFAITDSSNTVQTGSESQVTLPTPNLTQTTTGQARVTVSSAGAVYKLRWLTNNGVNSAVIYNQGQANSVIYFRKIAGFQPVSGQTADYGMFQISAPYNTNIAAGDHFKFATVLSGNLSVDTNTYTTTSGSASLGRINLTGGKTYSLKGYPQSMDGGTAGQNTVLQWYDVGGATPVALGTPANFGDYTGADFYSTNVETIYTPSSNTKVELRIVSFSSPGSLVFIGQTGATGGNVAVSQGLSYAIVQQLGTSTATTQLDPKYLQFTGARLYAGTTTSIPGTGVNTPVPVNTVEFSVGNINTSVASQITINQAGYYRLSGAVRINTSGTLGLYLMNIFVNGSGNVVVGAGPQTASAGTVGAYGSTVKYLNAGDVVTLGAYQNSGTAQTTVANQQGTFLDVQLLGI